MNGSFKIAVPPAGDGLKLYFNPNRGAKRGYYPPFI